MKTKPVIVSLLLLLYALTAADMKTHHVDPAEVSPDQFTILLENEHVRVLEYELLPGGKDAWHTHPPKVSYVISGGTLKITPRGADSFVVDEIQGRAAWMGAVGPHFGENIGSTPIRIALIEVKSLGDARFEVVADPD